MKRLNPNIYPKDGHFFRDKDGVQHRADSWPGVIARVAKYRQRAGQPIGDPVREVTEQACSRYPLLCNDESGHHADAVKKSSLKSRVLGWMGLARAHKAEQRIEYVDAATANARAQTCATCPLNQSLSEGCASCRQALEEMRKEVLGRRPLDRRLNACLVLGEDLQTAAHLERPTTENAELPGHCWRKRTL